MADEKGGWRQFQRPSFDSKKISKRMKKAEGATIRHAHKFILGRLDSIRGVRRHIVTWLSLVGVTIIAVGLQFVWFQQSYQTSGPSKGGTYAEASLGPIETLDPLYAASSAEMTAGRLLFSSLYSYDATGHLQGDLAESMKVDPTGTIYTITIRNNAVWHDGTHLTAKDVAFTVDLIKNPETRSPLRINWQDVDVKATDDTTLQFTLPAIYAAFPHALTFAVLPEHILGDVAPGAIRENTFSRSPIGSGPFSFRLLQTADSGGNRRVVHMTAFERYYKGIPRLGRFEVHAYSDQDSIIRALRSGEVGAATDITGIDTSQVDKRNYDTISQPINSGVYALFNNDNPILKDKIVRRALQLATDTNVIREKLGGKVASLDLPFITSQLMGADIPHAPAPNLTQAKALLDQAGWRLDGNTRKKDGRPLTLAITTTKNSQYERTLETMVGQWRRLGVVVTTSVVNTSDPSTNFIQEVLQNRNYDVLLYELFIGADPDVYAYWHSSQIGASGYNFSNYVNKTADAAIASARSRLEPELRNAKYIAFSRQWLDDVPAIGLYQATSDYVFNKHVQSVDPASKLISAQDRFSNVLYWSVGQESVYKTP
jgi:peptide/nickel transport system substrate-binding protein